jgi:hypothetical protein
MRNCRSWSALVVLMFTAAAVPAASAQTCIVIDEQHDMLAADERPAAVLLVKKELTRAGQAVAEAPCDTPYTVSHVRLGNTIIVTIAGPLGSREGKALGLDDLPAVYSQMVRSLVTGQPMGSVSVLDRSNVSAAQDLPPRRVQSEGFWHARVGYASLFGPATHNGASFGVGYRAEFDRVGLDVSFFNIQTSGAGSYSTAGGSAMSLIKLEGLYFVSPSANRSAYVGGGLSYGRTDNGHDDSTAHGSGLQGELTAGYEIARVTSARFFAQADLTLPFYQIVSERYTFSPSPSGPYVPPAIAIERHYAPTLTISMGLGWQRARR